MKSKYEIVLLSQSNPPDYTKYNYALCRCCVIPEAIKFLKAGFSMFHRFQCPRCGEPVGYMESAGDSRV